MEYNLTEIDGIFYKVFRENEESNDEFYYRCKSVATSKPRTDEEYKKAIINSKIQRNVNFLNLKYK